MTDTFENNNHIFPLQFGVIFIIVDTIIWHNFTKDMEPKDFMTQTTFKGK